MATIETTLLLNDKMTSKLQNVDKQLDKSTKGFESLSGKIVTFASAFQVFDMVKNGVSSLVRATDGYIKEAELQLQSETKLQTIMRQRMDATDAQVNSIIALTDAQEKMGVVGGDVALAGGQELASYLGQTEALEKLIPAMNNMVAQQKGMSATGQDAVTVARMFGKVMAGQTTALSRVGVIFDDTQKAILETGNEMERAAILADIITQNYGNMNEELGNSPLGKIKQTEDRIGELSEKLGVMLIPWKNAIKVVQLEFQEKFINNAIKGLAWLEDNLEMIIKVLAILGTGAVIAGAVMAGAWAVANAPLIGIIAGIGLLVAVLANMGVTTEQILGFVGGLFGGLYAVIHNVIANVWNVIASFIEFFANVWSDPIGSVYRLFYDLFDAILGIIETVAGSIGALLGQDWGSDIAKFRNNLQSAVKNTFGEAGVQVSRMDNLNVSETVGLGADVASGFAKSLESGLTALASGDIGALTGNDQLADMLNTDSNGNLLTSVQNEIGIKGDDMQYLHDMAVRDYTANYQNITPNLTLSGVTIRETADVDGIMDYFADKITEMSSTALTVGA